MVSKVERFENAVVALSCTVDGSFSLKTQTFEDDAIKSHKLFKLP